MTAQLAHDYAADGWPTFPCSPDDKSPLTPNGLKGASITERIIDRWWTDHPDAMVGAPTGAPIGVFVLDIDIPGEEHGTDDGRLWLDERIAEHGALPETRTATTASGGKHYYFRHVEGVRNRRVADGVDCRGDGGFVILPGSVNVDGEFYDWDDDRAPIADAPRWLLDLLLPRERATAASPEPYQHTPGGNEPYVERAVEAEMTDLAGAAQGGRGYALNRSAFSMGQFVGAGAIPRGEAEARLMDAARANGGLQTDGERETQSKIKRGLEAGMREPRHVPEPAYDRDNTRLVDVTRMIANGLKHAHDEPEHEPANDNDESEAPTEERKLRATAFKWRDPATLPPREFVYGKHFIRKYVSVTSAPGGLGKSSNSIAEALAMTSGRELLGVKPERRLKVWLFNAEDPRDELDRRIMGAAKHFNLSQDDIDSWLFVDSGREQELIVAREEKNGVRIMVPIVEAVVGEISRHQIDVMIIDPFVSTHAVNENDNGQVDKVAKLWAQIADRTGCAIDVVHHVKKTGDREATVDDSRGAGALLAAARSARVLNRMSEAQAGEAGVAPADRFGYFSIAYGKANLSPLSGALEWRKLESVPLGNSVSRGNLPAKPQDHSAVVTEWRMQTAEDAAEEIGATKLAEIKRAVDNEMGKSSSQASAWAGWVIADKLKLDTEEDQAATRRRVSKLIKHWLEAGDLREVEMPDPTRSGAVKKFIKSSDWRG